MCSNDIKSTLFFIFFAFFHDNFIFVASTIAIHLYGFDLLPKSMCVFLFIFNTRQTRTTNAPWIKYQTRIAYPCCVRCAKVPHKNNDFLSKYFRVFGSLTDETDSRGHMIWWKMNKNPQKIPSSCHTQTHKYLWEFNTYITFSFLPRQYNGFCRFSSHFFWYTYSLSLLLRESSHPLLQFLFFIFATFFHYHFLGL